MLFQGNPAKEIGLRYQSGPNFIAKVSAERVREGRNKSGRAASRFTVPFSRSMGQAALS
jgi:hypothetical protein